MFSPSTRHPAPSTQAPSNQHPAPINPAILAPFCEKGAALPVFCHDGCGLVVEVDHAPVPGRVAHAGRPATPQSYVACGSNKHKKNPLDLRRVCTSTRKAGWDAKHISKHDLKTRSQNTMVGTMSKPLHSAMFCCEMCIFLFIMALLWYYIKGSCIYYGIIMILY